MFFAPVAVEIESLSQLTREVFGPIVHVVRYQAHKLDAVIDAVNATGYGLTLGVHTRVDATARYIASRVRAGNVYVNRNMIGAVVGVQPFGGRGLSGTGPKAGGPYYLHRFATEQTVTINTAAVGGNASLLTIGGVAEARSPLSSAALRDSRESASTPLDPTSSSLQSLSISNCSV